MTVFMRNRVKSLTEPVSTDYHLSTYTLDSSADRPYREYGTKETITSQGTSVAGRTGSKTCIDWIRSDYRQRIKAGEIINNPCEITLCEFVDQPFDRQVGYWNILPVIQFSSNDPNYVPPTDIPFYKRGWLFWGTRPSSVYLGAPSDPLTWTLPMPSIPDEQGLIDEVVTEAYSKVDTSEVSALVSIGEARETIKFLADSALRLIKLYKAVRSLNFAAIRKNMTIAEFGKRYLEYRYAINPLVREMDDYFQAVFVKKSYPVRQTFRSWKAGTIFDSGSPYLVYNSATYGTATAREEASVEYIIRAGVLCDIDLEKVDRYGLKNIAVSALDLVPLSFIADWFFNISQTLAAHMPNAGTRQLASWYSISKKERRVKHVIATTTPSTVVSGGVTYLNVVNSWNNCRIEKNVHTYRRIADPDLRTFPQLKISLDGWKLLDLGLIVKQLITIPPAKTFVKRRKLSTIEINNKTLVW